MMKRTIQMGLVAAVLCGLAGAGRAEGSGVRQSPIVLTDEQKSDAIKAGKAVVDITGAISKADSMGVTGAIKSNIGNPFFLDLSSHMIFDPNRKNLSDLLTSNISIYQNQRVIEQNAKIIEQNDRIIALLEKIAGK